MNTVTSVPLQPWASWSSVSHYCIVKLWNAVSDLLEMGKRKAGFWVYRGKLELKQLLILPAAPMSCPRLQKQSGASWSQKHLLGRKQTAWQAFLCCICKQIVQFAPVLETFLRGWAECEGGFQLLCTSQTKRSEAGEASGTKSKK